MVAGEPFSHPLLSMLSDGAIERAIQILAESVSATVAVFDETGELLAGPAAGSRFVRVILETSTGREGLLAAHRADVMQALTDAPGRAGDFAPEGVLDRFVIPVTRGDRRLGFITLGDRPRQPLSPQAVEHMEVALQLKPGTLGPAAQELPPWDANQAAAARHLAALMGELFAELSAADENLRRRIDELSAVYNIVGLLSGTLNLQGILDRTARIVCQVMQVKACSIRMLDESSGQLKIQAVHNLSDEYLNKGPVTVEENPIDAAAIRGEMVRIMDAPTDPRTRYPDEARKEGIVSGLVCGMIYRGKAVGVIRVYTGETHVFTPFEEALLRAVAAQAAAAVINARLLAETLEAERYARQIAYAGEIQRRMIPANPPVLPSVDIGAVYRPTYQLGGDLYDFIPLPHGNLGVGIADVSGKGVPASLLMASVRSALRVYARFTYDVDRILYEVNRHVCSDTKVGEFVTAFYGVITPDGRRLTYSNAGHDPPMLLRGGSIERLTIGGMVLGVDCTATFERAVLELRPGDILLLYTDGAAEALNFTDERFGRERLEQSLRRYADQSAQLIAQNILWDIRRFRGLADRTDDVTLVVLKIR
ncbi:MAG TPA: SpoIIE family protein phosphatase [Phycisphaerae bacterium]|jgi:sigma-B regulation protein RsbU (phosphoserine phosphatase)|nr:SpoIIE family protein phosphatase [Phycisphaerae bacterium]HOB76032.1 SpoIIE family protein phosphatase [Phycisphaerae bacterium]HOJ53467.1 SpoIIE family protein phosphatase [Phycisphaerae bacterium]HOL25376.1 SpoIIE family protein phosphatase [Phycisphaerae bacterium]HPP21880.1 SpoIIE family protein phosphatase [Phycisphaerae bacterium]